MGVIVTDGDFESWWSSFAAWLSHPGMQSARASRLKKTWTDPPHSDIYFALVAWAVTFTLIMILVLGTGFGPAGVIPGAVALTLSTIQLCRRPS